METTYPGPLPKNVSEWRQEVQKYGAVSIHELQTTKPASGITLQQFLSLKAVWPLRKAPRDLYDDKTAKLYNSSADDIRALKLSMEKDDDDWRAYICAIRDGGLFHTSVFSQHLGAYALVLQTQLEVSKMKDSVKDSDKFRSTPRRTRGRAQAEMQDLKGKGKAPLHRPHDIMESGGPTTLSPIGQEEALQLPVGDEQIVNTAAINFLNALFLNIERPADWTSQRKSLKFNSNSVKFEARTDGHLKIRGRETSAAILEVKPRLRHYQKGSRIEMQESTQMALWIFQEPDSHWAPLGGADGRHYRVLLSQDRQEIYVTIADYTESYVDYLYGKGEFEDAECLRMQMFGPFFTDDPSHMAYLGAVLRKLLPFAADYSLAHHVTSQRHRAAPPEGQPEALKSSRRRRESVERSSTSGSDAGVSKLRFAQMDLEDKPRGRVSGSQERAPRISMSPFPPIPRAKAAPVPSEGQQGKKRAGKKGGQ